MAIDAWVEAVILDEPGGGYLSLIDRAGGGIAGQSRLFFTAVPYEVTALNWLNIWGGGSFLMLGEDKIATREGYTRIVFVDDDAFKEAVRKYHARMRQQSPGVDGGASGDTHA